MLRLGPVEHGWRLTYLAPRGLFKMGVGKGWAHFFFFFFLANVARGHSTPPDQIPQAAGARAAPRSSHGNTDVFSR